MFQCLCIFTFCDQVYYDTCIFFSSAKHPTHLPERLVVKGHLPQRRPGGQFQNPKVAVPSYKISDPPAGAAPRATWVSYIKCWLTLHIDAAAAVSELWNIPALACLVQEKVAASWTSCRRKWPAEQGSKNFRKRRRRRERQLWASIQNQASSWTWMNYNTRVNKMQRHIRFS